MKIKKLIIFVIFLLTFDIGQSFAGSIDDYTNTSEIQALDEFVISRGGTTYNLLPTYLTIDADGNMAGPSTLLLPNEGLYLYDTDATHSLIFKPNSNLTADRTLSLSTGDRNISLSLPLSGTLATEGGTGYKNILNYGAVCDGSSHTLANASKNDSSSGYANTTAALVDFPNASITTLTQEIDQVALEEMIANNYNIFIPDGAACQINYEAALSSKVVSIKGGRGAKLEGSGATLLGAAFDCTSCTPKIYDIELDGNNIFQQFFNFNNITSEGNYFSNIYMHDFGWSGTEADDWVVPIRFEGNITKNTVIKGWRVENLISQGDGTFGNAIGAARGFQVSPASSSTGKFLIDNFHFNSEGSEAEELDLAQCNVNFTDQGGCNFYNPYIVYTGEPRRCLKFHSGRNEVVNPIVLKSSSFTTASTAIGSTNVGDHNVNCIDWASSTSGGSLDVYGGYMDVSGFAAGVSNSNTGNSSVRVHNSVLKGGIYQVDRDDPETGVYGTKDAYVFITGTADDGSGIEDSRIINGHVGAYLRSDRAFARNNYFDDPVKYALALNPTSLKEGLDVIFNRIVTKTSGYLNSSRVIPASNIEDSTIMFNSFHEDGNTTHTSSFINVTSTSATNNNIGFNSAYPASSITIHTAGGGDKNNYFADNGKVLGSYCRSTTAVGNIGTGTDNLQQCTLDRSYFGYAGVNAIIKVAGTYANNANAKTFHLDIGGTDVIDLSFTTSQAGTFSFECNLYSTGSSTQGYYCTGSYTGAAAAPTVFGPLVGTLSLTDTNTILIKGEGIGTTNNDVVQSYMSIIREN